jgi:hypothetical protein
MRVNHFLPEMQRNPWASVGENVRCVLLVRLMPQKFDVSTLALARSAILTASELETPRNC